MRNDYMTLVLFSLQCGLTCLPQIKPATRLRNAHHIAFVRRHSYRLHLLDTVHSLVLLVEIHTSLANISPACLLESFLSMARTAYNHSFDSGKHP